MQKTAAWLVRHALEQTRRWYGIALVPADQALMDRKVSIDASLDSSKEMIADLIAVIDLTAGKVLRVVDEGPVSYGQDKGDWDVETVGPTRAPLNPLVPSQPMGPSFTVQGGEVQWANWRFHFRADMRRGLVVSQVRYRDGDRDRSVLYQGSLSELFVRRTMLPPCRSLTNSSVSSPS